MRYELNFDVEPFGSMSLERGFEMQAFEITIASWKKYPPSEGIDVPVDSNFVPAGTVGRPATSIRSGQKGIYIIEIPFYTYPISPSGSLLKRFYVGKGEANPVHNGSTKPGGVIKRLDQHRYNLIHFGINPHRYKIHVWIWTPNQKFQGLTLEKTERQVIEKNGVTIVGKERRATRNPNTKLTN
jgi:hypothetical protein